MKFNVSKVYTTVNADALKPGDKVIVADDLVFLRALVERGLQLNTIDRIYDENCQSRFVVEGCDYVYSLAYLVERKGEKHFRPYKDTDEMIADYKKRFNGCRSIYGFPPIWFKRKIGGVYSITAYYLDVVIFGDRRCTLKEIFDNYTYLDDTPCGVEE